LVVFIPKNELNDEFVKYFDEGVEFRRDTDFTFDHLTGLYYIDYSLDSGETDGLSSPAFLEQVDQFAKWYRNQPEVLHVYALTDIFKRLNKNLHADQPAFYRLPETRDLAAQYLLLYEMSLPYGLDLNDRIDTDKSATRLTVTLRNVSSKQVLDLERRADHWLQQHFSPPMQFMGSSPAIMFAHIGQRNIESMLLAIVLALVLISGTLLITLRSVKMGLISILPNLIPAAMAFGFWGIFVGRVGLALSVVTAMTLGVIVDDTVHFLSKYLRARREQSLDAQAAVRYAFSTVGSALLISSVVLMIGFLTLAFSSYEINAGMGLLTAIVIAMALLADFFFLPPLLIKMEDNSHEKAIVSSPAVEPSVP
jgi:predicted RND superfamily exporter protein